MGLVCMKGSGATSDNYHDLTECASVLAMRTDDGCIELHLCTPGRHAAAGGCEGCGHLGAQELDKSRNARLAAHKLVGCNGSESHSEEGSGAMP
jgi:hypothetical protein